MIELEYERVDKNAANGEFCAVAQDFAEMPCNSIVARTNPEECPVMSWMNIKDNDELLEQYKLGSIYRKINKEITPADLKPNDQPFLQTGEPFEHTKTLNSILDRMINVDCANYDIADIHKLKNAAMFVEKAESSTCANQDLKPRVKVEYVKHIFDCAWEAVKYFEESGGLYFILDTKETIANIFQVVSNYDNLYRKVETPITPMQAAKEACIEALTYEDINKVCDFESFLDNECYQKGFINICRTIVNAYDNKG